MLWLFWKIMINRFLVKMAILLEPEKAHFLALLYLKLNFLFIKYPQKNFEALNTSFLNLKLKNKIDIQSIKIYYYFIIGIYIIYSNCFNGLVSGQK